MTKSTPAHANAPKTTAKLLTNETRSGGELHQFAADGASSLTTNHGAPVSDDQNSLRVGVRGPTLLEDFHFLEKITHFDHERIPERIVHARGSGAHGYFEPYASFAHLTRASFLQDPKKRTPVFARFSTVAGGAGSGDLPRDVRGFAVKFYTDEGNFDLVGINIPVFFIQDALKFPDLIHSLKMEPDRGYPQAASAHDTFWDFVSLMPESMHMLLWLMSDRALPRSLRMMEGFGVHTFRFIDAAGTSTFVKFHWRPKLGMASVLWDEAVKIQGADSDYHRRDLYEAIANGCPVEYELSVQACDQTTADALPFDILDATKLIPEELIPLLPLGRMVLDRNPDSFFAETEQAAFHPGHIVPGIDFTNDPLLQGRIFSYTDTQLKRLGGPNFHELQINRPQCPMRNLQRDGMARAEVNRGRVAYEPNSLDPSGPREDPRRAAETFRGDAAGGDVGNSKVRERSATFSDHYSQAQMFWRSMSESEQRHIASAFAFELGNVGTRAIRQRMLGHLTIIDDALASAVADKLGMPGEALTITPARAPVVLAASPALSMHAKRKSTIEGRTIAVLATDGSDGVLLARLRTVVEAEGANLVIVAPTIGGIRPQSGDKLAAQHALAAAPSVLFDAVVVAPSVSGAALLADDAAAIGWLREAFGHLKVIGFVEAARPWFERAGVPSDEGTIDVSTEGGISSFLAAAKRSRVWARETRVRS